LNNFAENQQVNEPTHLDVIACQRLAAAVILQAVQEAMQTDPDIYYPARRWLASEGLFWIRLIDLNPLAVRIWIKRGCPVDEKSTYQDEEDVYMELKNICEIIAAKKRKKHLLVRIQPTV
jgi:hypothetical protein